MKEEKDGILISRRGEWGDSPAEQGGTIFSTELPPWEERGV